MRTAHSDDDAVDDAMKSQRQDEHDGKLFYRCLRWRYLFARRLSSAAGQKWLKDLVCTPKLSWRTNYLSAYCGRCSVLRKYLTSTTPVLAAPMRLWDTLAVFMAVDARAPKQVPADGEVAATAAAAAAEKSARKQPPTNQPTHACEQLSSPDRTKHTSLLISLNESHVQAYRLQM